MDRHNVKNPGEHCMGHPAFSIDLVYILSFFPIAYGQFLPKKHLLFRIIMIVTATPLSAFPMNLSLVEINIAAISLYFRRGVDIPLYQRMRRETSDA